MMVPLGPGLVELSQFFTTLKMICNNSARLIFEIIILKLSWFRTDNSWEGKNNTFIFESFFFFLIWTVFEVLLNLLQCSICFMFWFFWPWDMWDISSLTRNWTYTSCIGRWSLNHWTAREVLIHTFKRFSSNWSKLIFVFNRISSHFLQLKCWASIQMVLSK